MSKEVAIQGPRLPYHKALNEKFGVDIGTWKVLTESIYPNAKTADAVILALSYCKARELDPIKRPIHIVPIWDSAKGAMVETIWPGIAELRTTAMRTKEHAGIDEAEFGPTKTATFSGKVKNYGKWEEVTKTVTYPEWCRMTVYKIVHGTRVAFVGPKTYWLENCATMGKTNVPNDMWEHRASGQLEKCAEAAALRRAFPEELGNEYAAEEMEGKQHQGPDNAKDITPETKRPERGDYTENEEIAPAEAEHASQEVLEPDPPMLDLVDQFGADSGSFLEEAWVDLFSTLAIEITKVDELKQLWENNLDTIKMMDPENHKKVKDEVSHLVQIIKEAPEPDPEDDPFN